MTGGSKKGDEFLFEEHWCHHHIVKQMACAEPWVIGAINIAGLHGVLRIFVEEMRNGRGHGVYVAGRSGHRLGDHVALCIINTSREVTCFACDGAKGGAEEGLCLFFDHCDQTIPHHLGFDGL